MNRAVKLFARLLAATALCILPVVVSAQGAPGSAARPVGTVKSISGNNIVLNSDSGGEVTVVAQEGVRMLRTAPGSKDLKDASPVQLQDLQVGDRMLVRGQVGADGKSVTAVSIIVMKESDIAKTQAQERDDWQRHGVGGLVKAVDPSAQLIAISTTPDNSITIHVSPNTGLLRYAPDSIRFSDAQKGTFDQIRPGDQLRARGARTADGKDLTADEIISGAFRNIAGTVNSVDAAEGKLTVMDLLTKKPVTVKISSSSQLRKLPEPMATRLARLLKGGPPAAGGGAGAAAGEKRPDGAPAGGQQAGGTPDLQQVLSRTPAFALADLQKGDAVMIVTTPGAAGSDVTAVTLVAGVEPILTAAPSGSGAASLLSAWNMSAGDPGGD